MAILTGESRVEASRHAKLLQIQIWVVRSASLALCCPIYESLRLGRRYIYTLLKLLWVRIVECVWKVWDSLSFARVVLSCSRKAERG